MSQTAVDQASETSNVSVRQWCSSNRHFLVVAVTLAVVWAGWTLIMVVLDLVFHKMPVPWPEGIEVNPVTYQMLSLKTNFGPDNRYERAGDGELFRPRKGELFLTSNNEVLQNVRNTLVYRDRPGREPYRGELGDLKRSKDSEPILDGVPDGEKTLSEDTLDTLAIGTYLDQRAYSRRRSSWYVSRVYIDRSKRKGEPYRLWQLDVTYYTGTLSKVPHFPERCLTAAGMVLGNKGYVKFQVPEASDKGWAGSPVECRYVEFSNPRIEGVNLNVQYYVFSYNGRPMASSGNVRSSMASIRGKYAYFAKIQFQPVGLISDSHSAKEAADEFVKCMLPEVLKALPMPEDIERLESGAQQAEKKSN